MKNQSMVALLLALVMALGTAACSGNDERDDNNKNVKKTERPGISEYPTPRPREMDTATGSRDQTKAPPGRWIKSAKLTSTISGDSITLRVDAETTRPPGEDQFLTYVFWKNGDRLGERSEGILEGVPYKRGDSLFAQVLFHREEETLDRKNTNYVRIENIPPDIIGVSLPDVKGPGTYTFVPQTSDKDGDQLSFSLLPAAEGKTLPEGLSIDQATGTVTYVLGKKPPPAVLEFTIAADDGNNGNVKRSVSMTFKKQTIKKPPLENENSGEKKGGKENESN
ncbi:MAG: hypothetical protein GY940_22410 [bacterium]|nr:hypothetical protein [bacterium]